MWIKIFWHKKNGTEQFEECFVDADGMPNKTRCNSLFTSMIDCAPHSVNVYLFIVFSNENVGKCQMMCKTHENSVSCVLIYAESEYKKEIVVHSIFEKMHQIKHL